MYDVNENNVEYIIVEDYGKSYTNCKIEMYNQMEEDIWHSENLYLWNISLFLKHLQWSFHIFHITVSKAD